MDFRENATCASGRHLADAARRRCLTRLLTIGSVGLTACAAPPAPLDMNKTASALNERLREQIDSEEPLTGLVSMYDAMARALKYNLDQKIEQADVLMRERQMEARSADMLPTLVAGITGTGRSNDAGARSRSLLTGRESLEPSTSSARNSVNADLALSWDVLDFGLARARQRQQANERMIAVERRRKVMNRILEDVRTAYWRAVSADRNSKKLGDLQVMTARALRQSEALEQRRKVSPGLVLGFQRDLIQVAGEVQRLQRELSLAKNQLAALMNLIPDTAYRLILPNRNDVVPELPGSADAMVLTGLRYRSEVRESAYRQHILSGELDMAKLRALPSVRNVLGLNVDDNKFLYNKEWINVSARLSWNLLEAFRYPKVKRAIQAEEEALQQRDLALTMAIMTQIYVARSRFLYLAEELGTARRAEGVQRRLQEQARSAFAARAISQQQLVREELNYILAEIRYDVAYSDAQNAYANLYASMGVDDFDVGSNQDLPLKQLSAALEEYWTERANSLPSLTNPKS